MAGVSQKTLSTLQGLPFDNMIGGPLNACINAQANAAQTTINFIHEVGLQEVDGKTEAVYVYFTFIQNGRKVSISVPLLSIVPIPYIGINTIDINFKATISGVESSSNSVETTEENKADYNTTKKSGIFRRKTTTMKGTISTKKDSKSTQDSKFSVEATIDVAVHASQDSMPAGMAKVLELLGSALDLCDPNGEISVADSILYISKDKEGNYTPVSTVAQYKSPQGEFNSDLLDCGSTESSKTAPSAIFNKRDQTKTFSFSQEGIYKIYPKGETDNFIEVEVKLAE